MLLRHLFEAARPSADAAFAFGRFNPAHQGHIEVYKAVQSAGKQWFIGTNPSTQGANDPLTFDEKSAWMTAIYPAIKGHILPEQSVVTLASKLYEIVGEGKTIAYVTDEKDWQWAGKLLNDYNGKEGPHGYYKFNAIQHVESPRVSSATALRTAARANDENAFYAASGTDPKLTVNGQTYFDTVVAAVGANPEKVKKVAKKKEPVAAEGTMGVSKNKETEFHAKLDKLVHNAFGKRKDEDSSKAMANTAGRLANKDDGKVAKLRAAGDKRREDQLKGRNIAKRDTSSKDEWGNLKDKLGELSTELLGKYKKAAHADAKKADADGKYARGDKRFKGINRATNKQFDNDLKKHGQQSVAERVRDPEDWDEGNTEPANNFAVYINGKKWKVFKGRGRYADDYREQAHYQQLKDWAAKKSEASGKKWTVSITGEAATE
jgi:hypothetical protein